MYASLFFVPPCHRILRAPALDTLSAATSSSFSSSPSSAPSPSLPLLLSRLLSDEAGGYNACFLDGALLAQLRDREARIIFEEDRPSAGAHAAIAFAHATAATAAAAAAAAAASASAGGGGAASSSSSPPYYLSPLAAAAWLPSAPAGAALGQHLALSAACARARPRLDLLDRRWRRRHASVLPLLAREEPRPRPKKLRPLPPPSFLRFECRYTEGVYPSQVAHAWFILFRYTFSVPAAAFAPSSSLSSSSSSGQQQQNNNTFVAVSLHLHDGRVARHVQLEVGGRKQT